MTNWITEAREAHQGVVRVPEWPKERRVGRREDMSPTGHLEVMLDGDSDVIVCVTTGSTVDDFAQASVEFCTVGQGGGSSPRTRAALVALMLAIEADNAESPRKAWPPAEGRTSGVDASGELGGLPAEIDRDTDGELLIDWSPGKGRMVTLSLRADGRLSYAFTWDEERAHGTAQMPAGMPDTLKENGRG